MGQHQGVDIETPPEQGGPLSKGETSGNPKDGEKVKTKKSPGLFP